MRLVSTRSEVREAVHAWRRDGVDRVGFVPTMGALHAGHGSLIRRSVSECPRTVVSIFVNPTQFAPGEDLSLYPRTPEADVSLCGRGGADLVFFPSAEEMYGPGETSGARTEVRQEAMERLWCGRSRPTHFRGVLTVVAKLFHCVGASDAYFGRKDYQQFVMIREMARALDMPVRIHGCETVREPDGLAMSSRNRYLDTNARGRATGIVRGLEAACMRFRAGELDAQAIAGEGRLRMETAGLDVEYVGCAHPDSLEAVSRVDARTVVLVAARAGGTRLIDNVVLGEGVLPAGASGCAP